MPTPIRLTAGTRHIDNVLIAPNDQLFQLSDTAAGILNELLDSGRDAAIETLHKDPRMRANAAHHVDELLTLLARRRLIAP